MNSSPGVIEDPTCSEAVMPQSPDVGEELLEGFWRRTSGPGSNPQTWAYRDSDKPAVPLSRLPEKTYAFLIKMALEN
ncbi:hypothetical protein TNCV_1652821 [Trichonephila clavipes]|nr:hypothetical protein TNCV_1652821 [Trichonephila clavipes]